MQTRRATFTQPQALAERDAPRLEDIGISAGRNLPLLPLGWRRWPLAAGATAATTCLEQSKPIMK